MKRLSIFWLMVIFFFVVGNVSVNAQKRQVKSKGEINDSNTPLHLLQPDYPIEYGIVKSEAIKDKLNKVVDYLDRVTPALVEDKTTAKEITDHNLIDRNSQLRRGDFRLGAYEWGVTYSGMLRLAEVTEDNRYGEYVTDRMKFLAAVSNYFRKQLEDNGVIDGQMRQILNPRALDDAGAVCAAMIKASRKYDAKELLPLIENYMNYIMYEEYRLTDGTFARNRPHRNTVWLDDMYMSLPALVQMGKLTKEDKYYNEAAKQVKLFAEKMYVPEKKLFRHGWVESMKDHPAFFWGRANGWALLTMCEVLDELPARHPQREFILNLLQEHIRGLAPLQSGQGAWHQLLDRNDSYLETSATAIFTYCIAHAINKGWIDAKAYGPVAQLGWQYLAGQITNEGQVMGTCVGTGMAFDPAFYYHRPVNNYAAHGYGPVLLAGAEMLELLKKNYPKMNDSAIQYYDKEQLTTEPIFSVQDATRTPALVAGSTRKKGKPVIFLVGDSTVKNGQGKGDGGQWGWGSFFEQYVDTTLISVENHALGGTSSRTFITGGFWEKVFPGIQEGDYVFIQFGHNDGGSLNTGRARATLRGTGEEKETVIMERTGGPETVYTFGHYLRRYIRQSKAQGAIPIVVSPTPVNRWTGERVNRYDETYARWAREVAEQEGVAFIDLNELTAVKYEKMGKEAAQEKMFKDSVHTTHEGALLNCESVCEGIMQLENLDLKQYLKTSK